MVGEVFGAGFGAGYWGAVVFAVYCWECSDEAIYGDNYRAVCHTLGLFL